MFRENKFVYVEILPGAPGRRRGRGFDVYSPKSYEKTSTGKLEKIEREISSGESQKVLEKLDEVVELKCPKCNSQTVEEDDSEKNYYKFRCFDCGYEWKIKMEVSRKSKS